jgi:hypothetical protein
MFGKFGGSHGQEVHPGNFIQGLVKNVIGYGLTAIQKSGHPQYLIQHTQHTGIFHIHFSIPAIIPQKHTK